jgi:ATP-dependent helicase/nuclease subunit B
MTVRFILGRSGTGKTSYCVESIVNSLLVSGESRCPSGLILLVPEQATYQAERSILTDERIAGYHRLHVLSFDRLQFLLMGKNTARDVLSNIGRQMIIHRILRDNADRLKIFGSSAAWPGLSRRMAETIAELHQYAKTPADIEQLLSELQKDERNSLAFLKFSDIGSIFSEYLKFIEGNFLDPDFQLTQAVRAVATSSFAKGAKLWVDGFAGFTTAELAILTELLKVVEDAQIALCLDPSSIDLTNPDAEKLDPVSLFSPTERTYSSLFEIIKKSKLDLTEPVILNEAIRFSNCPQLAHIERSAFKLQAPKMQTPDNIRIISVPNERFEVEFITRQIIDLVREKSCRYRDIAIIASNIGTYEHYIRAYFEDYGIPFFIDRRKPLNHHPVVQLICSALRAITGGFSSSDVFTYLKTDLVPVERYEIDLIENYCLAFGVAGNDWQSEKQWNFAGKDNDNFDEKRINKIRRVVSGPLLKLRDKLCPTDNPAKTVGAEEFTQAVFTFLDELKVKQTVGGWIEQTETSEGDIAADEHRQFFNKLVDVFDELVEVFAGHAMTAEDYLAIINSAFSQLTLAFIPPKLDQVLVGSIERSRHPDLKAAFLIGATQGQFPVPVSAGGILTDNDRKIAEATDFPLAAATSQTLAERQYLAYIAFTRPSEFLYVTYPSVDEKGSAVPRSQFVTELASLFEDLGEESIVQEQIDIDTLNTKKELADLLCSQLGKDNPLSETGNDDKLDRLLEDICSDEQLEELGSNILYALSYDNCARLDGSVVEELFGRRIQSSATRLSTFAACPYQYFARYVLELKEREEFKFEPLDLGAFYHRVLDSLLKRLNAEGKDFATIEDGELLKLLKNVVDKLILKDSFISHFIARRSYNQYIIHSACGALEDCVLAIAQMVREGEFKPTLSEVAFGQAKDTRDTLGMYELALSDNRLLSLNGKIDRLDVGSFGGEKAAIVFDYKRSENSAKFSWSQFYHGLNMQLPIYVLAVQNATQAEVKNAVGAFYMPIEIRTPAATLDELLDKADTFEYKAKGIFNGEFFQQLDGTTTSGWSKFYSFRVTSKDGQYGNYGTSSVLKPNDFESLLRFAEGKIVKLAEEIASGKIDVKPYRINNQSPCSYCKYKSVCRFDWQINDYNFLESLNKTQALEKMEAGND